VSNARRWLLWILLLGASAALAIFGGEGESDQESDARVVDAVSRDSGGRPRTDDAHARNEAHDEPMILALRERKPSTDIRDSFSPHDWAPPPPRPTAPPAAAAPSAPPLPYKVLGKKLEDGVWQVFLTYQERVYVVKEGDILDNTYRVDEIRPPAMILTYVPLNERQMLAIGSGG
jgi:hypothetical protein